MLFVGFGIVAVAMVHLLLRIDDLHSHTPLFRPRAESSGRGKRGGILDFDSDTAVVL